jgi:hypothetical protein
MKKALGFLVSLSILLSSALAFGQVEFTSPYFVPDAGAALESASADFNGEEKNHKTRSMTITLHFRRASFAF